MPNSTTAQVGGRASFATDKLKRTDAPNELTQRVEFTTASG